MALPDALVRRAKSCLAIVLVSMVVGCSTQIQKAQVRISEDLATTFKLVGYIPNEPKSASSIVGGIVGGPVGAAVSSPNLPTFGLRDLDVIYREQAIECGAKYSSRKRGDGREFIVERNYGNLQDLEEGFRCSHFSYRPPVPKLETQEGIFTKRLTYSLDYFIGNPISLSGPKAMPGFPTETTVIMPWAVKSVQTTLDPAVGKIEYRVYGDNQVIFNFESVDCLSPGKKCLPAPSISTMRLSIVSEKLKVDMSTIFAILGLTVSVIGLLFGSGVLARRRRSSSPLKSDG